MNKWELSNLLVNGTDKRFDLITGDKTLCPGDLLLRPIIMTKCYHFGVYEGQDVIEYTAPVNAGLCNKITSFSSNSQSGKVHKISVETFAENKSYRVLRLKTAIPENFAEKVKEAMKYDGIYHPLTNNCLHFALRLLELEAESIPESRTQQRAEEIHMNDLEESAALTMRNSSTTTRK